jgi:hypothetical protein
MIAPPRPSSHEELEALIKEARARQLRRRLLGAAGVAIGAALGLSVYAFVTGGSPADLAQPPAQGGRATGPLCRASQLSVSAEFQGATGSMAGGARLTNTSSNVCSLPIGAPRVQIFWHGRVLPARQVGETAVSGETPAHVLAPGAKAFVYMQWSGWCGYPPETKTIRPVFRLRLGRLALDTAAQPMSTPRCDAPGSGTSASTISVSRPVADT